jgi:hypothetical protein
MIFVSTEKELKDAIYSLKEIGGDIFVRKGTPSFGLNFWHGSTDTKAHMSQKVTVQSEDPKTPFVFSSISCVNSKNIEFRDVNVFNQAAQYSVNFHGSENLGLVNAKVSAKYDPYILPLSTDKSLGGVQIRNMNGAYVKNCSISRTMSGFGIINSDNVLLEMTTIKETLRDNMNVASNNKNISIINNRFIAPVAKLYPEHHYDMLQFWAQTDSYRDLENVKIIGNQFISRNMTCQSIFGRADYGDNPYVLKNFEVAHNFILARHTHGISLAEGDNIHVHHNTLVYGGPLDKPIPSVEIPGILISKTENRRIHNNILPKKWGYPASDTDFWWDNTLYDVKSEVLA